jgi:hypothetical protein
MLSATFELLHREKKIYLNSYFTNEGNVSHNFSLLFMHK